MTKLFQHSLRSRISVAVFLVLTISFAVYLFINSRVNNALYSAELNQKVYTTVAYSVEKIDRYTSSMEQKTTDLALAGEVFYRMRGTTSSKSSDDEIIKYLIDNFKTFPEAIGGGLWFEPNAFKADQKYYGPYAYWEKGKVVFTWDLNTPTYDYLTQDWYTIALPADWNRQVKRDKQFYWTAPYFDEAGTQSFMITVDAFMYDDTGAIIGLTTADWSIEQMITFLEESKISSDSQLFLVEGNSNIMMANTLDVQSVLKDASTIWWIDKLVNPEKGKIKEADLTVDGIRYKAYYTLTEVGMFYGMLVPLEVIVGPLSTLFTLNLVMLLILMLFLIIMLYVVLSGVTNPIVRLTHAVQRISEGDLLTQINITSKDEIGTLGNVFMLMQKNIKEAQSGLEEKVKEKTVQLSAQVEEVKKSKLAIFNLLEDLEVEKKNVEEVVVVRTKELQAEKARLLASINSLSFGFIIADIDDNIILSNPALMRTLDLKEPPTRIHDISKSFGAYKESSIGFDPLTSCRKCMELKEAIEVKEISYGKKSLRVFCSPISEENSVMEKKEEKVIGYIFLVEDITEAKVMERSRDEFFAVASHELRTPLTAIRGNSDMILEMYADKIVDTDMKEMLQDIKISSIRLIAIVNDFLEVSRLEHGKVEMRQESFDLTEVIVKVKRDMEASIEKSGIALLYTDPASPLPKVFADRNRVEQILVNLVGNAVKFTEKGSVTIGIEDNGGFLKVLVSDTGIGISEYNQTLLFRKFQSAGEHVLARDVTQSTGLGLYICRLLISQMGGTIGIERSEVGKGSTFVFTVPLAPHTVNV